MSHVGWKVVVKVLIYLAQDLDNRLVCLPLPRLGRNANLDGIFADRGHTFSGFAGAWFDAAVDEEGGVG